MMNLIIKNNVNMMNMSLWDKIFVMNFYNGNVPYATDKERHISNDVLNELERLYNLDKSEFEINTDSLELIRQYENEIKVLEMREEYERANYFKNNKYATLVKMSEYISNKLYEEYRHIVDTIRNLSYPNSFKYLLLNETLTKTYKLENGKKIVAKRKQHETIQEHMALNSIVIDYIFNNIKGCDSFSKLYFESLAQYAKIISQNDQVSFGNVKTYGKGKWIKFNGYHIDQEHYQENSQKLSSLVQNTPWCTKTLAGEHLKQGNFYVFVDNNGQPHIAVKMNGNEIDEVRGIDNGFAQEIENEYREIVLSFLKNNIEIKYGVEWLEKEEANKRLNAYIEQINNEMFDISLIENLLDDLCKIEYKSHGLFGGSHKKKQLFSNLMFRQMLESYFHVSSDDICYGDCIIKSELDCLYSQRFNNGEQLVKYLPVKNGLCSVPYKIIFGNIYPDYQNLKKTINVDLQELQRVYGNCILNNTMIRSLDNLEMVSGDLDVGFCRNLQDLGNLKHIGGIATFEWTRFKNIGNLDCIYGDCHAESSRIESLIGVDIKGKIYTSSRNQYLAEDYYLWQKEETRNRKH